jgi:hypothetical protein
MLSHPGTRRHCPGAVTSVSTAESTLVPPPLAWGRGIAFPFKDTFRERDPALRHPVPRPESSPTGGLCSPPLAPSVRGTTRKGPREYSREPFWLRCWPRRPCLSSGPWRTRDNVCQVWYSEAARGAPPPGARSPAGAHHAGLLHSRFCRDARAQTQKAAALSLPQSQQLCSSSAHLRATRLRGYCMSQCGTYLLFLLYHRPHCLSSNCKILPGCHRSPTMKVMGDRVDPGTCTTPLGKHRGITRAVR